MNSDTCFYPGNRLSFDSALCTVIRPNITIPGTKGEWLGVEWDNPSRGKHNGTYKGSHYFSCKSEHSAPGSFIRPTRKIDPEVTVIEAIRSKYADHSQTGALDAVTISGKVAEEIGFAKIIEQQSVLSNLRVVILDSMLITGVASRGSSRAVILKAREELGQLCPNVTQLDLSYNPIENWTDVEDICEALPNLRVLKLNIRLRSFEIGSRAETRSSFNNIQELHLNQCLLKPQDVLKLLQGPGGPRFPLLQQLWLSENELSDFALTDSPISTTFETVQTLMFENNLFTSLDHLPTIMSLFPQSKSVSFQSNLISIFGGSLEKSNSAFTSVQNLNLSQNKISSFSFIDLIPRFFSNLRSLRVSQNPIYDAITGDPQPNIPSASQTEKSYYLTVARIPTLKTLNYTDITPREREEGEIYYLSVAEKDIRTTSSTGQDQVNAITDLEHRYPRYKALCEKHDRDNLMTQLTSTTPSTTHDFKAVNNVIPSSEAKPAYAPGTIVSRLITATFYISNAQSTSSSNPPSPAAAPHIGRRQRTEFTRDIPKSTRTSTVFALVGRELGLQPLGFKLVYESDELDPVRDDVTTRSQVYADRSLGAARWDDWGDWDADALVRRSLSVGADQGDARERDGLEEGVWKGGVLFRDGRKWKYREVVVSFGMRDWGDWFESGVGVCRVRVELGGRAKAGLHV